MSYTLARVMRRGITLSVISPERDETSSPAVEALSRRPANWATSPIGLRRFTALAPDELPAPLPELPAAWEDFGRATSLASDYLTTYGAEIVDALISREVTR